MGIGFLGKFLILFGLIIMLMGLMLTFSKHIPYLGRLPGDIFYERGSVKIYFPLMTSVLISIILTLVINLIIRR